jgi:type IV pilus assembly protein PilA
VVTTFAADGSNGLPTAIDSQTVVFTPSIQGQPLTTTMVGGLDWACTSTTSATASGRSLYISPDVQGTLPAKYAPSECR